MHEEQTSESQAPVLDSPPPLDSSGSTEWLTQIRKFYDRAVGKHTTLGAVVLAFFGVVALAAMYWMLSLPIPKTSDDAALILYAEDILRGNVMLHGWTLPSDSLFLSTIPAYVLGRLFFIPMTTLLYLIPSLSYAVLVVTCLAIVWNKVDGDHRLLSVGLVFAVIALPSVVVSGPPTQGDGDHVITVLFILVTYYLLSGENITLKPSTLWIVAALLLTAAAVGDPLAIIAGALPLMWVGARFWLSDQQERARGLLVVGLVALVVSTFLRWVIPTLGGFKAVDSNLMFVAMYGLRDNFYYIVSSVLALFGGDFFSHRAVTLDAALLLVHFLMLILVLYLVYRSTAIWTEGDGDLLLELLLVAIIMNVGARLVFTVPTDDSQGYSIPLTPVLFFSALIAGMWWYRAGISQHYLRIVLPVVLVCYLTSFLKETIRPMGAREYSAIDFLEKNGLSKGFGMNAHAAIITVLSEGKLQVYPVDKVQGARLAPVQLRSSRAWYQEKDANFLVFGPEDYTLNPKIAARTWGRKPNHMDIIGFDRIWRWDTPIEFSAEPKRDDGSQ